MVAEVAKDLFQETLEQRVIFIIVSRKTERLKVAYTTIDMKKKQRKATKSSLCNGFQIVALEI